MLQESIHALRSRIQALFHRRQLDRDLDEELNFHLAMREQKLAESGAPRGEAGHAARRRFGNTTQAKEASRELWTFPFVETLWHDLRYGLRQLRHNPGFAAIAILMLALGIGASTAIFSVVDAVLLRPLPYPHPEKIVTVWEREGGGQRARLADPNFLDFRAQNHTLSALAAFSHGPDSVSGGSEPLRVDVAYVSHGFFNVLGVEPSLGRTFSPREQVVHGAPAMIVSYGFWRRFLGGSEELSSLRLTMDGTVYPVIGVMPRRFDFPAGVSAWVAAERYGWSASRTSHNAEGIGRLRDGVTLTQARSDLDTIARRIYARYGKTENPDYFLKDAVVVPLAQETVANVRPALLTLFGAVILLFLVACANVAGLLLARTAARRKELAVRAALGAGRGRLVQQLLGESAALALAGAASGILLAAWTVNLLPRILPADLPRRQGISMNPVVLAFAIGSTAIVALGLGFLAGWRASRADVNDGLSAGSRGPSGASQKTRRALVVGEIAATLVLLVGAGLLGRSFWRLISVSPGFNGQNLMVAKFSPPLSEAALTSGQTEADIVRQSQIVDRLLARIRAIPGVESAGVTGALPVADPDGFPDGLFLILHGQPAPTTEAEWGKFVLNKQQTGTADYAVASGGLFRTAGIPLLRGRLFNAQDGPTSPHVAVITETLAREKWPNRNPIGQSLFFGNMDGILKPLTIVGVAGDIRAEGLEHRPSPVIFVDYRQRGLGGTSAPAIVLRTSLAAGAIVASTREIFHDVIPNAPVQFSTYAQALGGYLAERRFLLLLAGVFAGAALALAAAGIYGLVAYSVTRRTHEIGLRMALGAQRSDVLRLILGESARLAAFGLILGLGASLAATRLISGLLFGIKATDPLTFILVGALLAAVALLASYIPARRAMRIAPVTALKYE